jgi:hypothetical protein
MRKIILSAIAVTALAAGVAPAFAADARWSDAQYLHASRCAGLAQSEALGAVDASTLVAELKAQARGRESSIADRGVSLRADSPAEPSNWARASLSPRP